MILLPYFAFAVTLFLSHHEYPVWINRKIIHIVGIFAASLYAVILPLDQVAIVFGVVFGSLFLFALPPMKLPQRLFEMGTREGEESSTLLINNIFTYGTLAILFFILQNHDYIFLTAAFAVSFGDGFGEIIGRPFGKHQYKILGMKSLEGSIGVFIGTFGGGILSLAILGILHSHFLTILIFTSFLVVAVEGMSVSYMDNVLIPIFVSISYFIGHAS